MSQEIERKFLVKGDFKSMAQSCLEITQGYLSSVPERSVRIRISGDKAYITIKGITSASGTTRYEWEKELELDEAKQLIKLCEPGVVEKRRYLIPVGSHTFEVDEFLGDNVGLVIAEVELQHENESFQKPDWLGKEVTGIEKYYNAALSRNPYQNWEESL